MATETADRPKPEICKAYDADAMSVQAGERSIIATISTATVDRDKEVVLPKGGDLKHFRKNPVVLLGHNYHDLPIGRATWIKVSSGGDEIIAKTRLVPGPRGDEVLQLFQGGFLKAFSIGFDTDWKTAGPPTPDEILKNAEWANARMIHRKWTLLEYSVVTIPANPDALAHAVSKGAVKMSSSMMDVLGVKIEAVRVVVPVKKKVVDTDAAEAIQHKRLIRTCPQRKVKLLSGGIEN